MKKELKRKAPQEVGFTCTVICYFCETEFTTNKHLATDECRLENGVAKHYGFCGQCQSILKGTFYRQMERKCLPKPRLRLETEDQGGD